MNIQELIDHLEEKIQESEDRNEDPNSYNWGMEEGVLISQNQAKEILEILKYTSTI